MHYVGIKWTFVQSSKWLDSVRSARFLEQIRYFRNCFTHVQNIYEWSLRVARFKSVSVGSDQRRSLGNMGRFSVEYFRRNSSVESRNGDARSGGSESLGPNEFSSSYVKSVYGGKSAQTLRKKNIRFKKSWNKNVITHFPKMSGRENLRFYIYFIFLSIHQYQIEQL